jgi:uncharacterized membrane protein
VGGFLLAYLSRQLGWAVGLWASRVAQLVAFVSLGLIKRRELHGRLHLDAGFSVAIGVGAADLLGVAAYSIGAESGFISIVLIASAVFPLIAVGLSIAFLEERPVPNQYLGVALVVVGLVTLGLA